MIFGRKNQRVSVSYNWNEDEYWTPISFLLKGIHYGCLSIHYVDAKWQLRVLILACQAYDYESQHAVNLRAFTNEVLKEFDLYLDDNIFIVTDNENKMKSAFKEDVQRIGCSAHYLNKLLQHAFTINDIDCDAVQSLFKIVRSIVTKVRQCHKQSLLSSYLQNYCDTRFNGVYLMFNSFLKVYHELPTILSNEQKQIYFQINRDNLHSLCSYLKKFCDVIEKLSCEKTPTLHLVIPYKQFLINQSIVTDDDQLLIIPLKTYIGKELPNYWIISDVHYIATMLHPNLKSFNHTPHERYRAESILKIEFDKCYEVEQGRLPQHNSNQRKHPPPKKSSLSVSLDDVFDLPMSPDKNENDISTKTELERYLADETKIDKEMNVLVYWNNNQSTYPILGSIARRVLSVPATNTTIERLFSISGNTVTNRRTRLQTSKVNQLLFIRRNLMVLRELFPPSLELMKKRKNSSASTTPMKKTKYSTVENDNDDEDACNETTTQVDYGNETFDDCGDEENDGDDC